MVERSCGGFVGYGELGYGLSLFMGIFIMLEMFFYVNSLVFMSYM